MWIYKGTGSFYGEFIGDGSQLTGVGSGYTLVTVSASYTETVTSGNKKVLVLLPSADVAITLPSATNNTSTITVKRMSSGSYNLFIIPSGSQAIDDSTAPVTMSYVNSVIAFSSANTYWIKE